MKKILIAFSFIVVLGAPACGATGSPVAPGGAPVVRSFPITETAEPVIVEPLPIQGTSAPNSIESISPDLRVVYVRDGNLWSWTENGGNLQLTATGDMTTARLSADGQRLAFVRRSELWTVRMDGTDARMLTTFEGGGGALFYGPKGMVLAASTNDHIEVIDLRENSSTTVVTYPSLPEGYYPEIVWTFDGMGFKTVIPPQDDAGRAQLLFIFTDGTVASLAEFPMASISDSFPAIAPDGGYIIYIGILDGEGEALYLMDSSGATRPYSARAGNVRALGWLPDSKHFVYLDGDPPKVFLGDINGAPVELSIREYQEMKWVDGQYYVGLRGGFLYIGDSLGGEWLIDNNVSDFDLKR